MRRGGRKTERLPLEGGEGEGTKFAWETKGGEGEGTKHGETRILNRETKGKEIQKVVTVIFKGFSVEKAWVWALWWN